MVSVAQTPSNVTHSSPLDPVERWIVDLGYSRCAGLPRIPTLILSGLTALSIAGCGDASVGVYATSTADRPLILRTALPRYQHGSEWGAQVLIEPGQTGMVAFFTGSGDVTVTVVDPRDCVVLDQMTAREGDDWLLTLGGQRIESVQRVSDIPTLSEEATRRLPDSTVCSTS